MTKDILIGLVFISISLFSLEATARALISINVQGKTYNLVVFSDDEHKEAISLFNENIRLWKRSENITKCSFVIDLPEGTAQGNHSYGGYCTSWLGKKYDYLMICSDVMRGKLKIQSYGQSYPKKEINALARFVADNCTGG